MIHMNLIARNWNPLRNLNLKNKKELQILKARSLRPMKHVTNRHGQNRLHMKSRTGLSLSLAPRQCTCQQSLSQKSESEHCNRLTHPKINLNVTLAGICELSWTWKQSRRRLRTSLKGYRFTYLHKEVSLVDETWFNEREILLKCLTYVFSCLNSEFFDAVACV